LKIDGDILIHPSTDVFLPKIGARVGFNLTDDPARYPARGDIAGIDPDIVLIQPETKGVYIIENKPYYGSSFDGNQGPGGAYIDFVLWLNMRKVPCEYLVVHSVGWSHSQYQKEKQIQKDMQSLFGVLLLEDIFLQMSKYKFSYSDIIECWSDFADKGTDFVQQTNPADAA
jgi:hypothetical protein